MLESLVPSSFSRTQGSGALVPIDAVLTTYRRDRIIECDDRDVRLASSRATHLFAQSPSVLSPRTDRLDQGVGQSSTTQPHHLTTPISGGSRMSLDLNASTPIVIPARKQRSRGIWLVLAALGVLGGSSAWALGLLQPPSLWFHTPAPLATLDVDQGEIALVVTENGSLESSNNATARCHVEALIGMVGGDARRRRQAGADKGADDLREEECRDNREGAVRPDGAAGAIMGTDSGPEPVAGQDQDQDQGSQRSIQGQVRGRSVEGRSSG